MGQVRPYGSRKRRSDNEPAGAIGATSDGHAQGRQTMTVRKGKITRARLWVALDPSNFMSWNRKKVERWYANSVLNRPPVIGFFLIIQVADASDTRSMALVFRPVDRFVLGFESAEHMVRMVFNDIVLDRAALRTPFGARFNVNARHVHSSCVDRFGAHSQRKAGAQVVSGTRGPSRLARRGQRSS